MIETSTDLRVANLSYEFDTSIKARMPGSEG